SRQNGVWHLFQQGTAVTLPLTLTVPVAQWLLGVSASCAPALPGEVGVRGFETPLLLEPGRAYPFELRLPADGWDALQPRQLPLLLQRAGLAPQPLTVPLTLVPGGTLQFGGGSPRAVEVRLGRRVTLSLPLAVRGSPAPPPVPPPVEVE